MTMRASATAKGGSAASVDGKDKAGASLLGVEARSTALRYVSGLMSDASARNTLKGLMIGFFVAFLIFYADVLGIMSGEVARWRQNARMLAAERDEYKKALEIVEQKMVQSEAQVLVAQKTAMNAVDRATGEVRATQSAARSAMGDVVFMKDNLIKKHKMNADREARTGAKHKAVAEETKVQLGHAASELKKVEAAEDAWDRFHQGAVSRSVRYGSHVNVPNIPHPDANNHAAKVVTGWRLGQRLAIRGGEGNVHGDNLKNAALKQTETFGISGKKGRKLLLLR